MTSMTMNLKKVFTSTSFNLSSVFYARFCAGSFYQEFDECRTFLLYKKKKPLTRYLLTHQQLLSCFVSVYYSVLQRFICFQHSPWYGNNHPYQCLFLPWHLVFVCPKGTQSQRYFRCPNKVPVFPCLQNTPENGTLCASGICHLAAPARKCPPVLQSY